MHRMQCPTCQWAWILPKAQSYQLGACNAACTVSGVGGAQLRPPQSMGEAEEKQCKEIINTKACSLNLGLLCGCTGSESWVGLGSLNKVSWERVADDVISVDQYGVLLCYLLQVPFIQF